MSKVNGEKARANISHRNRTARRASDRARLAEIRKANESKTGEQPAPAESNG